MDPSNYMGPVINESAMKSIMQYIEIGRKEGRLVAGGRAAEGDGFYLEPTVIADVDPSARIAREEIFGPVLAVLKAKDLEDAIRIAKELEQQGHRLQGIRIDSAIAIGGVARKQLVTFTRQLSTLQDAGLPILRSLQILEQQQKPGLLKAIIGGVAEEVEGGATLSDSMAKYPKAFDKLYVNMIAAGEAGGILDTILNRLAAYSMTGNASSELLHAQLLRLVGPEKAARGKLPTDTWWHTIVATNGAEKTGYPTQKPLGVINRIVRASSNPGDLVMDFFAGSGTVGESCLKLGRRFLLVDNNPQAMDVMARRFGGNPEIEWVNYRPGR